METILDGFSDDVRTLALNVSGGVVLFKVNGSITGVGDLSANTVDTSYEGIEPGPIDTIHLFSTSAATVQWHIN